MNESDPHSNVQLTLYILISPCIFSVLISLIILIIIMIIVMYFSNSDDDDDNNDNNYDYVISNYFGTYQKARLKMNKLKVC